MSGRSSWRQRSSVRVRHTRPRPWVTMKLMASGVTNSAAMTRSPSFSRSSSSTRMTMRPARSSAMISATEAMPKDSGAEPGAMEASGADMGSADRRENVDFTAPWAGRAGSVAEQVLADQHQVLSDQPARLVQVAVLERLDDGAVLRHVLAMAL